VAPDFLHPRGLFSAESEKSKRFHPRNVKTFYPQILRKKLFSKNPTKTSVRLPSSSKVPGRDGGLVNSTEKKLDNIGRVGYINQRWGVLGM
jgi:hypothetical protein